MTGQRAANGLVELVFPGGGRVLVDFRDRTAGDPGIEAAVIRMLLDAEETDGDMCAAIDDYAAASGLTASYYLGDETMTVVIGDPAPLGSPDLGLELQRH